jgi:hypothetical protein
MKTQVRIAGTVLALTMCLVAGLGPVAMAGTGAVAQTAPTMRPFSDASWTSSATSSALAIQRVQYEATVDALNSQAAAARRAVEQQAAQYQAFAASLEAQGLARRDARTQQARQAQEIVKALNSGTARLPVANPPVQAPPLTSGSRVVPFDPTGYQLTIAILSLLLVTAIGLGLIAFRRRPNPTAFA